MSTENTCPDCAVAPGEAHVDGCDVARCTACGAQRIGCDHGGEDVGWGAIWTGRWPGVAEVEEGLAVDLNDLERKAATGELIWDGERWQARRVYELVYDARAAAIIRERWPEARMSDASDFVHEGRFEVVIDDCDPDEFYAVMILEGWSGACLGWEISLLMPDKRDEVLRRIELAKAMKEDGYVAAP